MEVPPEFSQLEGIQELISVPNQQDINCHKAVLFLAGVISYQELTSDSKAQREAGLDFTFGKQAQSISSKEFVPISNKNELYTLANQECTTSIPCIGQILDAQDKDMAHSFLIAKRGSGYICFDKAGFKTPFSSYTLEKLLKFENYQNQLWRFLPLESASGA